ncbi:hypothetical protein [Streptomyces sp. NPDC057557]|uniref:hypothetical protein n=1 Tax=Streptomyces sp. NPDC057557 TaxID=3346167 RepID=UPI00367FAB2D
MPEDEQLGFLIGVAAQEHPRDGSSLRATLYSIEMITPTWSQPRTLYRPDLRR